MGKKNRYPGIRAFEASEQDLFFGRETDKRELFTQVKAQPLVVLFAKSGIGKSSLINAGLRPRLENEYFIPIKIRLQDQTFNPTENVKKELEEYIDKERLQKFSNTDIKGAPLWEVLRSCDFGKVQLDEDEEVEKVPVLIFDQFEEFFDHDTEARQELVEGLADLLEERLPRRVRSEYRKIPIKERSQEIRSWYRPLAIKILLAIRSDKLSLLDELANEIPIILKSRYHLKPMGDAQARAAITLPALLDFEDFITPPFDFDEATLNGVLNYLSNEKGEIESFQLQLVCQYIEKEVLKRNPSA